MLDRVTEDLTARSVDHRAKSAGSVVDEAALRAEIRRLVAAELSTIMKD